jgi:hypothetical protein
MLSSHLVCLVGLHLVALHAVHLDHTLFSMALYCACAKAFYHCAAAGMLGYFRPSIPITKKDLEARGMTGADTLERLTGAAARLLHALVV